MACKFIEIGQGQNLFIGDQKKLMQWSASQGEVTKDNGDIMHGNIVSMVQTCDRNYLFLSDRDGY
jgi:WD40 repeat protein